MRLLVAPVRTSTPSNLRVTILAGSVLIALAIAGTMAGSEIDLSRLMPGGETSDRPRIVVVDGKIMNRGGASALNLEITRPSYRLLGTLAAGEGIAAPSGDFSVQYEWNDGDKPHRESRTFNRSGSGTTGQRSSARSSNAVTHIAPLDSGPLPSGLTAAYDPATHLLTVSASDLIEVRVDGYLLRPVSRTDKDGAEFRYAQANLLVLGQDLRRGETTTFEVVFTKPQEFYSIPIYVREPGKSALYFTVSTTTSSEAAL